MAFPLHSLLAFVWIAVKKLSGFNEAAFKVSMALISVWAAFYFYEAPKAIYDLSILPVMRLFLRGSSFGGYFQHPMGAGLLLSAPLCLAFQIIFDFLNGSLRAPEIITETAKGGNIDFDDLQNGDDVTKGVYLGVLDGNKKMKFYLGYDELTKHTALVGTTGSGKTTTIYNFVRYAMLKRQAMIIIDGKGDNGLVSRIELMTQDLNRMFYLFSTKDNRSLGYNPLSNGNATELTDKIMSLTDWSEEHYKLNAQRFLQLLFKVFALKSKEPNLINVVRYCNRSRLEDLLKSETSNAVPISITGGAVNLGSLGQAPLEIPEEIKGILRSLEDIDKRAIGGLASRLGVIAEGDLGELLKERPTGLLELTEAIDRKGVVVFSLDSLSYPEQARLLGRLVISDIKSQISLHGRQRPGQRVSLIFDEFNVFVSSSVVDLVNKSRAAGFEALLAFQSLADIDRLDHGKDIRRQIIQNCNTLIVQRQNDPSDAEELANIIGTDESYQLTYQISDEGATGVGSARGVKKYIFHPDDIKKLKIGEALVKHHTPQGRESLKVVIRPLL
jgi:hypothetical protein